MADVRTCRRCGKNIPSHFRSYYCSIDCLTADAMEKLRPVLTQREEDCTKICEVCGKPFVAGFKERTIKKYCSAKCVKAAAREQYKARLTELKESDPEAYGEIRKRLSLLSREHYAKKRDLWRGGV